MEFKREYEMEITKVESVNCNTADVTLILKAWAGMPADTHADLVARCKKLAGVD